MPPHNSHHAQHHHHQQHKSFSNLHLPNVMEVQQSPTGYPSNLSLVHNGGVGSQLQLINHTNSHHPPMVTQTYNWQAIHSSAQRLAGSNVSLNNQNAAAPGGGLSASSQRMLQGSSSCLDLTTNRMTNGVVNGISNSCTNVNHNNNNNHSNSFNDRVGDGDLKSKFLPGYRKAPDYETAVRQKYQRHVSSSQSDVYQASQAVNSVANQVATMHLLRQQQQQQKQAPTSSQFAPDVVTQGNGNVGGFAAMNQLIQQQQLRLMRLSSNGNIIEETSPLPPHHNQHPQQYQGGGAAAQPPPYPNRMNSTSTPDLALITQRSLLLGGFRGNNNYVSGSSPDLVSSRTLLNMQLQQQRESRNSVSGGMVTAGGYKNMQSTGSIGPQNYYINGQGAIVTTHGTYENLNCIGVGGEHQQQVPRLMNSGNSVSTSNLNSGNSGGGGGSQLVLAAGVTATQQDQLNSVMQQQQQIAQKSQSQSASALNLTVNNNNSVIEPIYENLPLSCWNGAADKVDSGGDGDGGEVVKDNDGEMTTTAPNQSQVTVTHTSATTSAAATQQQQQLANVTAISGSTNSGSAGNGANLAVAMMGVNGELESNSVSGETAAAAVATTTQSVTNAEEMRDRASSVQSAPAGGVRGSYRSTAEEDVVVVVVGGAGDQKEKVTKTWSNPVEPSPQPRNVFRGGDIGGEMTSTVNNGVVAMGGRHQSEKKKVMTDGNNVGKRTTVTSLVNSPLNRSQSANLLDTSQSSQFTVDSGNISASTSNASIANTTGTSASIKEKKRGIWSILSRGKSNSSSSSSFGGSGSSKHKSATLGKSSKNLSLMNARDVEDNSKRWATGLPKMEPLSANMSKEQLVSEKFYMERNKRLI